MGFKNMKYTITEPEIIDLVKTTTYLKDGKAISGRLKEIPDEVEGETTVKKGRKWFIIYARTKNVGTIKEPSYTTKVDPELVALIPEDVDKVEVVFLDRIRGRNWKYWTMLQDIKEFCKSEFSISKLILSADKPEKKSLIKNDERNKIREASLKKVKKSMAPELKRYIGKRLDEL